MDNKQQKEFISNLRRPQVNQLALELQLMVTNFKLFLQETHGYTEDEVNKIMFGTKYEDLETTVEAARPSAEDSTPTEQPSDRFTFADPQDLAKLKREDEMHRRSLTFELEWCIAQIEQGNFPH